MSAGFPIQTVLIQRELQIFLRQKRTFVALLTMVLLLSGFVVLSWEGLTSLEMNLMYLEQANRSVITWLMQIQLAFVVFVPPFLFATSIAREREKDTFDILMASPISLLDMMLAKLLAPLVFMLILFLSVMPIYSVSFLAGGLSLPEMGRVYAIYLVTMFATGGLGMLASCMRPRVFEAYWITVLMLILLVGVIPFSASIMRIFLMIPLGSGTDLIWMNPFVYMGMTGVSFGRNVFLRTQVEEHYFVTYAMIGCAAFALSWLLLRFGKQDRARKTKTFQQTLQGKAWWVRLLFHDVSADLEKRIASDQAGDVLERRSQWYARSYSQMRMAYLGIITSLILLPFTLYWLTSVLVFFPIGIGVLFTAPLAATRINLEREHGTLDLLRTTLMPMSHLVVSRFWACWMNALVLSLSLYLPAVIVRCFMGGSAFYNPPTEVLMRDYAALIMMVPVYGTFFAMVVSFGLLISTWIRNSAVSTILTLGAITVFLLFPFCLPYIRIVLEWFFLHFLNFDQQVWQSLNLGLVLFFPIQFLGTLMSPIAQWLIYIPEPVYGQFRLQWAAEFLYFRSEMAIPDGFVAGFFHTLLQTGFYSALSFVCIQGAVRKLEQSG